MMEPWKFIETHPGRHLTPNEILRLLRVDAINFGSFAERDFFDKWFRDRTKNSTPKRIYESRDRIKFDWLIAKDKFREEARKAAKKREKKKKCKATGSGQRISFLGRIFK